MTQRKMMMGITLTYVMMRMKTQSLKRSLVPLVDVAQALAVAEVAKRSMACTGAEGEATPRDISMGNI